MKKFKKIILIVYILLLSNLIISKNLFSSIIFFLGPNLYFSLFSKLSQKTINKIFLFEFIFWILNSYFILVSNFDLWFLALNNLLWLLTSIKMIEVRNDFNNKNIVLFLLLGIGTSSLFNISFISNSINIFSLFLLIYSLLIFNKYKSGRIIKQLLILISFLPLTLFSFLSIPSPKPWLRQNFKTSAKTGISDKLMPGDISALAKSQDLVARVFFSNKIPKPENRYWRVFVLDSFKNNTWNSSTKFVKQKFIENKSLRDSQIDPKISSYERWILEPNFLRQRPWSGKGKTFEKNLHITSKGILLSSKELKKREEYLILHTKNSWRENYSEKKYFNINEIDNKSLYKLSKKWLNETSDPEEILRKAREWFLKGDFTYSINPGVMSQTSPYDDFLFKKKRGFCEHFAASFALLMKYANIPSRVVIGFQGGEIFKDAKDKSYILIDNSYAHAWNEIWIEKEGWVRIDPTSWVSPERIQESSLLSNKDRSKFKQFTRNINLNFINLTKLEQGITSLLEKISTRLKISNLSENLIINRIYFFIIFIFTLLINIVILLLLDLKNKNDFLRINLNIYLYLLNLFKFKNRKGETLKSFSSRIEENYPQIKKELKEIYKLYNSYKFSNQSLTKDRFLALYLKSTYLQIKVLSFIIIKNLNANLFKLINANE